MAKKTNIYFDYFIKMIDCSYEAAKYLVEAINDFDMEAIEKKRQKMHEIENKGDKIKHEMMEKLIKEFVTPIDREDIIELANVLDDVTDKIDDILIRIYMYNIQKMHPNALKFAELIMRSCKALQEALVEFPNFSKSDKLKSTLINVNTLEEEGDQLYIETIHTLFRSDVEPSDKFIWSLVFDYFEDCCDACEDVADLIEIVTMKNS